MKLFYVRFSGDEQGTTLEKYLKEIVKTNYDNSVCTEDAIECIYQRLCKDCETLSEMHPRCNAVHIIHSKPGYGSGHRIMLDRPNGGCNAGNSALLSFRMLYSYFQGAHESPSDIERKHKILKLSEGLCAYNL